MLIKPRKGASRSCDVQQLRSLSQLSIFGEICDDRNSHFRLILQITSNSIFNPNEDVLKSILTCLEQRPFRSNITHPA